MSRAPGAIVSVFERLQQSYVLGKTKTYAWRKAQLEALQRMLSENEAAFVEALNTDLGKSEASPAIASSVRRTSSSCASPSITAESDSISLCSAVI